MGLLLLKGVPYDLRADIPILEDECVDAVIDLGLGGIGCPFEKQEVALVDLRLQIPFGFRHAESSLVKAWRMPALPRRTPAGVMKNASSLKSATMPSRSSAPSASA
jgi:hypothetical protein